MKKWIGIIVVTIVFALPSFAIQSGLVAQDATITEADEGISQMFFTVGISATSPEAIEISFTTVDGNAKEGIDYVKTVGTLSLAAGQKNGLVVVPVINDKRNLLGEKYFYLAIDSKIIPLFRAKAKGTIIDNDSPETPLQKTNTKATILPKGERHEKR